MIRIGTCIVASLIIAGQAAAQTNEAPAIQVNWEYSADIIGAVQGGLSNRGRVLDNFDLTLDFDLEQLFDWSGVQAHLDILNNSGSTPNDDVGTLQGIDNIEVSSQRLRLFEAWVEAGLGPDTRTRIGLYDVNSEFYANDAASLLIAPAFGVGSELASTGPNGPSIFPSTALAARIEHSFGAGILARAALINAQAGVVGDPEGVDFKFNDGVLAIAEDGWESEAKLMVGLWTYSKKQDHLRNIDVNGLPEKAPARGLYIIAETAALEAIHGAPRLFVRSGISDGETTAFKGGWQAGVAFNAPFTGRPEGTLSLGLNQAYVSHPSRLNLVDAGEPARNAETQFELTYSDRLLPNVLIQPDLQWIRDAGGVTREKDAIVLGVRLTILGD